jgi:hypothetical protein
VHLDAGFPIGVSHAIFTHMATRRLKRPRDPIQLGKLIVDIATGQVEDHEPDTRDPAAVARGKAGGSKGGAARAARLSQDKRQEIAKIAATKRWARSTK